MTAQEHLKPTFHVYVRQGRYTKSQLDRTGEFTVSVPLGKPDPAISKICGWQSGYQIDKVKEAGLELEDPETIHTPGIRQYPPLPVRDTLPVQSIGKQTGLCHSP